MEHLVCRLRNLAGRGYPKIDNVDFCVSVRFFLLLESEDAQRSSGRQASSFLLDRLRTETALHGLRQACTQ